MTVTRSHRALHFAAWVILSAYVLHLLYLLAGHDTLTSLASDSVNYLVMALHYSPWKQETEVIRQTWPMQDFPPLFPLLLAWTGVAHKLLYAHALVVALGLAALYPVYRFSVAVTNNRVAAQVAVAILAVSPGYLLGLQDILSESLYLFLSMLFLERWTGGRSRAAGTLVFLGVLLGCVMLSRTAGFVLLLALVCQGVTIRMARKPGVGANWGVSLIAMAVFAAVMLLAGAEKETHYVGTLSDVLAGRDPTEIGKGLAGLAGQARTLLDTWRTFFVIYWLDDLAFNSVVVLALLLSSLWVLIARLRSNELDAWYVLGSIALLLIWPHPGQMLRLIFPLMPILVAYAIHGVLVATQAAPRRGLIRLLAVLVAALAILPAHAFMLGRIQIASERGLVPVYELFRRPGLEASLNDLVVQNQMMQDFSRLKSSLSQADKVLYFEPAYVAILGQRAGVPAPAPVQAHVYRELAQASGAEYVLVTAIHPRQTRAGIDGFSGAADLDGWTTKLWCSASALDGSKVSCLFRLNAAGR